MMCRRLEEIRPSDEKDILEISPEHAIMNFFFPQKPFFLRRTQNGISQSQQAHVMSNSPTTSTSYNEPRLSSPVHDLVQVINPQNYMLPNK